MRQVADIIAEELKKLYSKWPGAKSYGLAQQVIRKDSFIPVDFNNSYLGVDSNNSLISYHRINNITTRITNNGYGDLQGDIVNTYQMVLIVYYDYNRVKLWADELALYIQSNFPFTAKLDNIKLAIIRLSGMVLNSKTVLDQEYKNTDVALGDNHIIFQLNYTIEATFSKDCFKSCPC